MLAATAAVDFTPAPGCVLQGHAGAPPSDRVLHPLQARAIVFEEGDTRVGICTVDVLGLMPGVTARVRQRAQERCGIPGDHLLLAASHTHCAPASIEGVGLQPEPTFIAALEGVMETALTEAVSRLEPVTLGLGCGSATFNINRRLPRLTGMTEGEPGGPHPGGVVDRRVRLLRVDRIDGSPLAVLFHFSCHPVTKTGMGAAISSDYPGVARARIEAAFGTHALFMPGSFGNIRPAVLQPGGGAFDNATDEQLLAFGHELGDAVITTTGYTRTKPFERLAAARTKLEVPYAAWPSRDALVRLVDGDTTDLRLKGTWAQGLIDRIDSGDTPSAACSEMQALRVGPLVCVAIPGESMQEIGHEIERRLVAGADADDIWPMGYCNDMLGYLVTERHKQEHGYEARAYPLFQQPAPFVNEETVIVAGAEKVVGKV